MAAPDVVGTASGGLNGSGSFTVALPSSAAGYLAVAQWFGALADLTPPSGWTLVERGFMSATDGYTAYGLWTATSPGTSWTHGTNDGAAVAVVGYSGPLTVHQLAGTNGSSTTPTSPAVTTTEASLIARLLFLETYPDPLSVTYPSGHALGQVTKAQDPGADTYSAAAAHVAQPTPGGSGSAVWSIGGSGSTIYFNRAMTLALTSADSAAATSFPLPHPARRLVPILTR